MSKAWRQLQSASVAEARAKQTGRHRPRQLEEGESMALWSWAGNIWWRGNPLTQYLRHIPNGGNRNPREAARLRRMGVLPGTPDYLLPIPQGSWHGLWIELKATPATLGRKPTISPAQEEQLALLASVGYRAEVAEGWQAAARIICDYLHLPCTFPRS